MADPTPLLSQSDLSESDPQNLEKHIPSLDDTIQRCIGDFGWAQLFQACLVSLAWVFDAQQTFISVFTDAEPTWHCTGQGGSSELCNSASDICHLPRHSWAWDRPIHATIVSEWVLECAGPIITGLPASSFFAGCLTGGLILATLADTSLGRKNMLFISCLVMSLAGVFTVFSTNIWTYSALRFVSGFGRATIGTCALVLSTELVGKRWRGQVGVIGFLCFTLGFLSLPAIAYVNRASSWRTLYLWTSVPTLFYCILVHFFVRESPRWLFVQGRKDEAVAVLKSITPNNIHNNSNSNSNSTLITSWSFSSKQETWNEDLYSAIKILVTKRWAARRLSAVMVAGFGIGMVYYGMPLALGNLSVDLYLSVTLNAISELPASIVTFLFIGRLNRKGGLLAFTITSGVVMAILSCSFFMTTSTSTSSTMFLQVGLELASFFSACMSFNILLIYTIELFPTCVRNSAISMVRQALVFGGVFSPAIVAAGRKKKGEGLFLTYGVFGMVIGFCGLFVACLPETRGGTFCDTLDEEELKVEKSEQLLAFGAGTNNNNGNVLNHNSV